MTLFTNQARSATGPAVERDPAGPAGQVQPRGGGTADDGTASPEPPPFTLVVSTTLVTRALVAVIAVLTAAGFAVNYAAYVMDSTTVSEDGRLKRLLDLDAEVNLPTWYQAVMLAVCAIVLLLIGWNQGPRQRRSAARSWMLLSLAFFYLSLDELVSLHELTIVPLRSALDITGGLLYFAWVILAAAVLLLLGIALVPFLASIDPATRRRFVVAGALFVGGAFGLELVGGALLSARNEQHDFTVKAVATVEEFLEMLAIVLFFRGLLLHIAAGGGTIVVARAGQVSNAQSPARP
ncbi:MAG: hypothetical protein H0T72_10765 [Chloroflexia bacterium]|nr:hypothetical protein [Chloroflexia bacterium]